MAVEGAGAAHLAVEEAVMDVVATIVVGDILLAEATAVVIEAVAEATHHIRCIILPSLLSGFWGV